MQEEKSTPNPGQEGNKGFINEGASTSKCTVAQLPQLPAGVDEDQFRAKYLLPAPISQEPPKKILKIFRKREIPKWLSELGNISCDDTGKPLVLFPEALIAQIAGHMPVGKLEFGVATNVDLLKNIFDLVNSSISDPPAFTSDKPKIYFLLMALRCQFRSFITLGSFISSGYDSLCLDHDLMDNVILPGLVGALESIKLIVKHIRCVVIPRSTPLNLKMKFLNAPLFPLWPNDVCDEIKQFFSGFLAHQVILQG